MQNDGMAMNSDFWLPQGQNASIYFFPPHRMNAQLQNALRDLKGSGAKGIPSVATIETAQDNATWSGTKGNGDPWSLIKNKTDSYNVTC